MRYNFIKSILVPLTALGMAAFFAQACSGGDSNNAGSSGPGGCIPGSTAACVCGGGLEGVQSCNATGNGYGACDCGGGSGGNGGGGPVTCVEGGSTAIVCGNGTIDPGEDCDDGNCIADDACSDKCKNPFCGDKIVQAGEDCDDGQNEVGDMCPNDCQIPNDAGPDVPVDPCLGKLIFSGFTAAPQESQWSYMGSLGYEAGTKMCQAIGAAGVCDYEQLAEILNNPADHPVDVTKMLMSVPAGGTITAWVNRTTAATVGGVPYPVGVGGRCNNWTYETGHVDDGEFVTLGNAGGLSGTFSLDSNPGYSGDPADGFAQPGLDCGGVMRFIPCCFPVCQSP